LSDDDPKAEDVTPLRRRLRMVPTEPRDEAATIQLDHALAVVEHDGRMYDLADLIRQLSREEMREIGAAAPRSGQKLWDEVVRRWPALAAEIVAGAQPAG
jgi:hypothetical protein